MKVETMNRNFESAFRETEKSFYVDTLLRQKCLLPSLFPKHGPDSSNEIIVKCNCVGLL